MGIPLLRGPESLRYSTLGNPRFSGGASPCLPPRGTPVPRPPPVQIQPPSKRKRAPLDETLFCIHLLRGPDLHRRLEVMSLPRYYSSTPRLFCCFSGGSLPMNHLPDGSSTHHPAMKLYGNKPFSKVQTWFPQQIPKTTQVFGWFLSYGFWVVDFDCGWCSI